MLLRSSYLLLVSLLISVANAAPLADVSEEDIAVLCPEVFKYLDRSQPGKWVGNLTLINSEDLNGLWIRLIFDKDVSNIEVDVSFGYYSKNVWIFPERTLFP